jgi:magnesium-transporting ATPase (P-type)
MQAKIRRFGLTSHQAAERLLKDGPNTLPESKPPGFILLFLKQFKSPFIYVLLIAALVSFLLDHAINGLFIFAVLLLNAMIGSFQEYSAERAANSLNALVPQMANVLRDGHTLKINSKELVVDDLIFIASGDRVPADGICLETNQLTLDESMLTGESQTILKHSLVPDEKALDMMISNGHHCFAGTTVNKGRGLLRISHTGSDTEIGKIASAVSQEHQIKPPLLQRIERFTLIVTIAMLIIIGLIFIISILRDAPLAQVFFLGVALAVSAIHEGLPAAITVALAIGMRRMAKVNVIVRSLMAVESLGSCTYIASDKTGTLTVNDMTVQKILLPSNQIFNVNGEGHDIHGEITLQDEQIQVADSNKYSEVERLCKVGALCNESDFYLKHNQWQAEGDQVDIALLVLYNKLGESHQQLQKHFPEISRIPYESENSFSASLNRNNGQFKLSVKGSVEILVSMCETSDIQTQKILKQVDYLASQGYRVLGFADKDLIEIPHELDSELRKLTFVGMVGIIDPLRQEAIEAVNLCKKAQIQVAMITGDHPETAKAIANTLGIFNPEQQVVLGETIATLAQNSIAELERVVRDNNVFARVKPLEKQTIVEQLQQQGHFVAVTGDGVNDAPALKAAHVGIAMGKRGTDVARESSDLILTDDNFSSIVKGIIQGRVVYSNIRKVVFLLISTGAAEIFLFILSLLAGLPLPLFPIQLLWLNLVTNGVQDVALAFEPAEGNELNDPPRSPNESIFNQLMIRRVIINALVMGSIAFILFAFTINQGMTESEARNQTLLLMVLFENVHALNSRSEKTSLFRTNFFGNKLLLLGILIAQGIHIGAMYTDGLGQLLGLSPVSLQEWFYLLGIALFLIVVDEGHKWWHQKN